MNKDGLARLVGNIRVAEAAILLNSELGISNLPIDGVQKAVVPKNPLSETDLPWCTRWTNFVFTENSGQSPIYVDAWWRSETFQYYYGIATQDIHDSVKLGGTQDWCGWQKRLKHRLWHHKLFTAHLLDDSWQIRSGACVTHLRNLSWPRMEMSCQGHFKGATFLGWHIFTIYLKSDASQLHYRQCLGWACEHVRMSGRERGVRLVGSVWDTELMNERSSDETTNRGGDGVGLGCRGDPSEKIISINYGKLFWFDWLA